MEESHLAGSGCCTVRTMHLSQTSEWSWIPYTSTYKTATEKSRWFMFRPPYSCDPPSTLNLGEKKCFLLVILMTGMSDTTSYLTLVMLDPLMGEPIPWDQGYCGSTHQIRRISYFFITFSIMYLTNRNRNKVKGYILISSIMQYPLINLCSFLFC